MSLLFDPISTLDPYRRQMFEAVETGSVETVEQILVRNHSDEFFAHLATFRGYKSIYDLLNIPIDSRYLTNMYVVNGCYDQNLLIRENLEHPYTLDNEDLCEQILRDHPNDFKVRLSIMRVCIRHSFEELLLRIVRYYPDTYPPIYIDRTLLDQWSMGRVIDYLYDPETAKQ
ncbi:hypothetical protein DFQ28_003585 [Apophysomyces sp. BC1034]|nr:hypothetical protein DFQ30_003532 [Apophysomyces sp. BC1015]KAG0179028.1 hypothetical protein DFQ29_002708 [Apophysomyces sp. BC1021]KAG0189293.1 hypothetical protein DFQ28_003585 [Apophysomyces sp. BC1034]